MSKKTTLFIELRGLVVGGKYIGKTERCLISRMNEHGTRDTEPMFKHLSESEIFKETCNFYAVPSLNNGSDPNEISLTSHLLNAVKFQL